MYNRQLQYRKLGYKSYEEYLQSPHWQHKKENIFKTYSHSYYCWICNSISSLELHHENYDSIPKEKFLKDVFWLCHNCHTKIHGLNTNFPTPLNAKYLRHKRLKLRREHILRELRPSTLVFFVKQFAYRLFF